MVLKMCFFHAAFLAVCHRRLIILYDIYYIVIIVGCFMIYFIKIKILKNSNQFDHPLDFNKAQQSSFLSF